MPHLEFLSSFSSLQCGLLLHQSPPETPQDATQPQKQADNSTGNSTWSLFPPDLRVIKQVELFGTAMISVTNTDKRPLEIRNIIFNGQQCAPPPPPPPPRPPAEVAERETCINNAAAGWRRWASEHPDDRPSGFGPFDQQWDEWVEGGFRPEKIPPDLIKTCPKIPIPGSIPPNMPGVPFAPVSFPATLGVGQSMSYTGRTSCGGSPQNAMLTKLVRIEIETDRGSVNLKCDDLIGCY